MNPLEKLVEGKKRTLQSWCNCAEGKVGEDLEATDKIIADSTKELMILERYLALQEASRGLSVDIITQLVDKHYREVLGLDSEDNFIDMEK